MPIDAHQLAAFAAVIELGSFDAAATKLHVTPSAISQRIKGLEHRVGQVVVKREKPCTPTAAGVPLLRLAAQTVLLESEALAEMVGGGTATQSRVALAVNADSMSTWFTAVLEKLPEVLFDIRIEDQDFSARLLRGGEVMGAVTTERDPVSGCRVQPLGVMRYVPVASAGYVERHLRNGFSADPGSAPSLAWNRDDALQDMMLRKMFRRAISRAVHYVPTAEGFRAAVLAGLGWAMYPQQAAAEALADGSFVQIADAHLDVPLFWQCWKVDSPMIENLTRAVQSAAVGALLSRGGQVSSGP